MNKFIANEFYPTPKNLIEKITAGVKWGEISTILEPSAGKGDMADYIQERLKLYCGKEPDIDCIEIDDELRNVLKGKNLRVVHDDFLTFHTFKQYDLIIMNPPFSNGSAHLLKALDMQKDGGAVICILNAETIKNPYTNERKALVQLLDDLKAEITYLQDEFVAAERTTSVEIACIKVFIPKKEKESLFFNELKKRSYQENTEQDVTDLVSDDFVEAIVQMYNIEVESGLKLIQEYCAMVPHIMNDLRSDNAYKHPIIEMKVAGKSLSANAYVREVRRKYWDALFSNPKFTRNMTSNLSQEYHQKVSELVNYDFSVYNIRCIQIDMQQNLIKGIEDCIVELFDKLSYQYSYSDELSKNIHYYNGWKTNKAWYINKKVILPFMDAFCSYNGKFRPGYEVRDKLMDIEKALNYLDGGLTSCIDMNRQLDYAEKYGITKKITLKYFTVTFYKKGTCHIEFTNEDLLKKLNIFGSQQKRWLPPGYGKKTYQQMDPQEKAVIDEFEGAESYQNTIANAKYFLYDPSSVRLLEETPA